MEIKWVLRFWLIWGIFTIPHIAAKQFRAAQFNYAAEQRQWMLKHLESAGIIFRPGSPDQQAQVIRAYLRTNL